MYIRLQNRAHVNVSLIWKYVLATRPMFFTVSVLPVILGTLVGYRISGDLQLGVAVLALLAVVFVHAGVNVFNDIYDELNGTDRINEDRISPYTGGSRYIQNGIFDLYQMRFLALILFTFSVIFGGALAINKGVMVLVFGVVGIVLGLIYSAPPLKLASRGVGEFIVGFGFGVLPVVGAAWLQSGMLISQAFLISLPVSLWVTNILLINEVPDRVADQTANKRTLAVRYSLNTVANIHLMINVIALLLMTLAVYLNYIGAQVLIFTAILMILAVMASNAIRTWKERPDHMLQGIKMTLAIHGVNCLALIAWYLMS